MSLSGFARRAVHRACPGLATFARPYAANVATVSEEDSFLKWTTPEPQHFTHQSILAAPVTKVRRDSRAARAPRGVCVRAEAPRSPGHRIPPRPNVERDLYTGLPAKESQNAFSRASPNLSGFDRFGRSRARPALLACCAMSCHMRSVRVPSAVGP